MGTGLTAQQTVDMWYDEISDYGSYWGKDDVPMSVMHFTQVVWKTTTKVGCGVAACSDGNLVTCRYQEAGNMLGTFATNVGVLKSSS
ncbi:Protein PRY1 [Diplodia seriata]|uniref:Protein PRY1 n=2 Tax=Diplodia seriata TaxID=420778 RepID=A0A1S8BMN4_9PEZI|nr:Protein PRY1 [Diplodia seriata]